MGACSGCQNRSDEATRQWEFHVPQPRNYIGLTGTDVISTDCVAVLYCRFCETCLGRFTGQGKYPNFIMSSKNLKIWILNKAWDQRLDKVAPIRDRRKREQRLNERRETV